MKNLALIVFALISQVALGGVEKGNGQFTCKIENRILPFEICKIQYVEIFRGAAKVFKESRPLTYDFNSLFIASAMNLANTEQKVKLMTELSFYMINTVQGVHDGKSFDVRIEGKEVFVTIPMRKKSSEHIVPDLEKAENLAKKLIELL